MNEEKAAARKAYMKAWSLANPERKAELGRRWYAANKEHVKERSRKWAIANPEKEAERSRRRRAANPEKEIERLRRWREENPERKAESDKKYRTTNPEKKSQSQARYRKANPDKHAANQGKRRAAKLQATPAWADEFIISEIYELSQLRSEATGMIHHVDHIVPLKSKLVCGLHCEHNLTILTGIENLTKNNRHWPDMP